MLPDAADLVRVLAGPAPDVAIDGIVRVLDDDGSGYTRQRICWHRGQVRVEQPPGRMEWVVGERTVWRLWPTDPVCVAVPRNGCPPGLPITLNPQSEDYWREALAWRAEKAPVVTEGSYLGRATYDVYGLAGGEYPPVALTLDRKTGLLLRIGSSVHGPLEEWEHLDVSADPDPAWFTWDGPWTPGPGLPHDWSPA